MDNSILYTKAYAFAVKVVKLYKELGKRKVEKALARQLLRSGTSIAANIAEAIGSISKREFTAKMSIAYKETRETKYWLDLLHDTRDLGDKEHSEHFKDVDEIGGMLFSTIRKCRQTS